MNKFACGLLLLAVLFGSAVPVFAANPGQVVIQNAFKVLRLEEPKNKPLGAGGMPEKYLITAETIKLLDDARKANKVVVIMGDGEIKIVSDKEANKIIKDYEKNVDK